MKRGRLALSHNREEVIEKRATDKRRRRGIGIMWKDVDASVLKIQK
jgi:hypothetical protein